MRKLLALTISASLLGGCSPQLLQSVLAGLKDGRKPGPTQPVAQPSAAPLPASTPAPVAHESVAPPKVGEPCAHALFAMRWGVIPAVFDQKVPRTDWHGKITVDNGKIRLIKRLRFEDNDHIVPTGLTNVLEFNSVTFNANDGVFAMIMAAPDGPEPMIHVAIDGYETHTFAFHELADFNKLVTGDGLVSLQMAARLLPPMEGQCEDFGSEVTSEVPAAEEDLSSEQDAVVEDVEEDYGETDAVEEVTDDSVYDETDDPAEDSTTEEQAEEQAAQEATTDEAEQLPDDGTTDDSAALAS